MCHEFFFCILKSNLISEWLVFWFIWKHDMWSNDIKKWRMCSLIWCFQTHHKNDICFFCENIFVCIDCYYLLYLTVRICRAILMTMFFLIIIKTFIFCETSFSFIWFSRSILCASSIDIHEIVCKDKQIQKYRNNKLKVLLSIWLLISWSLIETEIFINLLI